MKKTFVLFGLLASLGVSGQNEEDVFRYSYLKPLGTARSMAMGGSMGALGADMSAVYTNPAGLAFYRANYFMGGFGVQNWRTQSNYIDQGSRHSVLSLNIPNLGLVFNQFRMIKGKPATEGLVSYQIGFTLFENANFKQELRMSGNNSQSSILDYFAERANGYDASSLSSDFYSIPGQAWNTYLINEVPSGSARYEANLPSEITMAQFGTIQRRGWQYTTSGTFSMNLSNRLFMGIAISIHSLRFRETFFWKENSVGGQPRSMTHEFSFSSRGIGYSTRLGAIFRINEYLRFGYAWQSGIQYDMYDLYHSEMSSTGFTNNTVRFEGEESDFRYQIRLPQRSEFGLAFLIPNLAAFSVDVEQVNYRMGSLSSNYADFSYENGEIERKLKMSRNIRVGAELLNGNYRYRAGFAWYGSPFTPVYENKIDLSSRHYSLGAGYQEKGGFYFDAAVVLQENLSFFTPYSLETTSREYYTAVTKNLKTNVAVTLGTRF